ncbi:MAG: S8 family serine peptidase, partial [candidate division Zixibacteria bacterium]|nr:S8 family serine peptidase [candidate division Zixibacteria bacterium]
ADATEAVVIGIVDTGVYYDHPDLEPNMWINTPEDINGNGIFDNFDENDGGDINWEDEDDNGYDDDVVGFDLGVFDPDPQEEYPDHGTHVAGCVSEATDNGIGGAGPGFSAKIMAAKAANSGGGLTATTTAMVYCISNNADFVNCSYGGFGYQQGVQDIISAGFEDGTMVIAAAGNDNTSGRHYPSAYEHALAVAATGNGNYRADFTNYGDWIDISSPGVSIFSTWAHDEYQFLQGTSMASPVCAGVAALIKAQDTNRTPADIWDIIKNTADSIALYTANPDWIGLLGSGRVDAFGAVGQDLFPNIRLVSNTQTVTNDDGDGVLNPGEGLEIVVSIQNYWSPAVNVTATISAGSDFDIIDGETDFGDVGHNVTIDNAADPFEVNISPDALVQMAEFQLTVIADGDYSNADTFIVEVALNQQNFPQTAGGNLEGGMGLIDINQDGYLEIIFGSSDANLYAYDRDGNRIGNYPHNVGGEIVGGVAVGQIDNQGWLEIASCTKNGYISIKDAGGTDLPGFPVQIGASYYSTPTLVDLVSGGGLEAVFTSFGDGKLYAYQSNGEAVPGFPVETGSRFYGSAAAGDLDDDAEFEIIAGAIDGKVYAWNHDGSMVPNFPVQLSGLIWVTPALGDLDSDNQDEILVGTQDGFFYALKRDGSIMSGFPREFGSIIKSDAALADIDNDGEAEIFVGCNGNTVYGIDGDGGDLSGWPVSIGSGVTSSPVIGDIDGDNLKEIIVAAADGILYGFNDDGTVLRNFPIPTYGSISTSSPALGDLDRDGDIEIIIGLRQSSNNVVVIDYKTNSQVFGDDWVMYGHDMNRQHRLYEYITGVDDQQLSENLPVEFSLSQNYPNPFNPATVIDYALPIDADVKLSVYNIMGRKVADLVDEHQNAGYKTVEWNAASYASGIYFYKMTAGEKQLTKKMLLIK